MVIMNKAIKEIDKLIKEIDGNTKFTTQKGFRMVRNVQIDVLEELRRRLL